MKKFSAYALATIVFAATGAFAESFDGARKAIAVTMPGHALAQTIAGQRVFDAFSVDALYLLLAERKNIPGTQIEKDFPSYSDIARFARGASRAFQSTGGVLTFEVDRLTNNTLIYQADYQPGDGTEYQVLFDENGRVIGNSVSKTTVVDSHSLHVDKLFTIGELPKASFVP